MAASTIRDTDAPMTRVKANVASSPNRAAPKAKVSNVVDHESGQQGALVDGRSPGPEASGGPGLRSSRPGPPPGRALSPRPDRRRPARRSGRRVYPSASAATICSTLAPPTRNATEPTGPTPFARQGRRVRPLGTRLRPSPDAPTRHHRLRRSKRTGKAAAVVERSAPGPLVGIGVAGPRATRPTTPSGVRRTHSRRDRRTGCSRWRPPDTVRPRRGAPVVCMM